MPTRTFNQLNPGFTLVIIRWLPNAQDRFLLALQTAKLTLAATTGILLARWGNGQTVLLEKVFGNIYIDKMWAICLLEADYNWLKIYVFAKCMMDRAFKEDFVPVEQFPKRGSQASQGVVASGLFCDIATGSSLHGGH